LFVVEFFHSLSSPDNQRLRPAEWTDKESSSIADQRPAEPISRLGVLIGFAMTSIAVLDFVFISATLAKSAEEGGRHRRDSLLDVRLLTSFRVGEPSSWDPPTPSERFPFLILFIGDLVSERRGCTPNKRFRSFFSLMGSVRSPPPFPNDIGDLRTRG